jgi:anaerobic dimethyl sulfoxide reductase subunit C
MNFREWPLVLFTVFGQTAAGAAVFLLLPPALGLFGLSSAEGKACRFSAAAGVVLLAALAAGLAFFHLGRPLRAPKALVNFGGSWLSRELILLLIFGLSAAGSAYSEWRPLAAASWLEAFTAAAGLAFVFAMARIYTLPAVPDWNSGRTAGAFFSTTFVLGAMGSAFFASGIPGLSIEARPDLGGLLRTVALIFLAAAVPANYLKAPRFGLWAPKAAPLGFRPGPSWPAVFAVRMILLSSAAFLWLAAIVWPAAFPFLGGAAILAALASEIVGRLQFYALPLGL